MIIDAHGHIGRWEDGIITPEYIIQLMDAVGIELTLISNLEGIGRDTDQSTPNLRTLKAVQSYPERLRGLVWVNPWQGEVAVKNARTCLETGHHFVGLKFHPYHNACSFARPEVRPFIQLAMEFDVPLAVHTAYDEFSHPDLVVQVAEQVEFSRAAFVLYHAGLGPPNLQASRKVFEQVARHPNLYIDISWLNLERLKMALDIVPLERILYGTDVPLGGDEHYSEYAELLHAMDLSKEEHIKLMETNARNLFKRL